MIENLSHEQLSGILGAITVDISSIDPNNLVRFWKKHETRVFKRSNRVLGKSVQNCHVEHSIDKVN